MVTSTVLIWAVLIGVAVVAYRAWPIFAKGAVPGETAPAEYLVHAGQLISGYALELQISSTAI